MAPFPDVVWQRCGRVFSIKERTHATLPVWQAWSGQAATRHTPRFQVLNCPSARPCGSFWPCGATRGQNGACHTVFWARSKEVT